MIVDTRRTPRQVHTTQARTPRTTHTTSPPHIMADTFKTSEVPAFSGKAVDWPLFKAELCIFLMRFSVDIDSADQTGPGISNQVANKRQRVYAVTMMTALPKRWLLSYYEMKDDGYCQRVGVS